MKEEKELYDSPQCESIDISVEGVICASQQTDQYQFGNGGGI